MNAQFQCGRCRTVYRGDLDDPHDRLCAYCAEPPVRTRHRAPPAPPPRADWKGWDYFHHVYPQPGCDVSVLPEASQPEARAILAAWRRHGPPCQGWVDLPGMPLLDVPRLARLLDAGFFIELDAEPPYEPNARERAASDAEDAALAAERAAVDEADALMALGFESPAGVREIRDADPEPPAPRPAARARPTRHECIGPFRVESAPRGPVRLRHGYGGLVPTPEGGYARDVRFDDIAEACVYARALDRALHAGQPRP